MTHTRLITTLATLMLTAGALAVASRADARTHTGTPVHFAGLPPAGVKASTPTTGKLVLSLRTISSTYEDTDWDVYADGRLIWQTWTPASDASVVPSGASRIDTGYVQQRFTPAGVQLLRSKILATGLFGQNVTLEVGGHHAWTIDQVRVGNRFVRVEGVRFGHHPMASAVQLHALAWIEKLVAAPERALPATVWADRRIRAFVPACYQIDIERGYPDPAKLPPPVGKALARQLKGHSGGVMTTRQTRALLHAFVEAGIAPTDNHAGRIGFSLGRLVRHPSYFAVLPALPDACV